MRAGLYIYMYKVPFYPWLEYLYTEMEEHGSQVYSIILVLARDFF